MRVLYLVVARAGSRSVPHKNTRMLGGHPLLAYRIASATTIADAEHVWLSTDDPDYARAGQDHGATIPFLRPAALARDTTPSIDVVRHAMDVADDRGQAYDALALLEPSSPFVLPATLQSAVDRLAATPEADAIVATRVVRPSTFYVQPQATYLDELARRIAGTVLRRQDEVEEVTPSGGFYIARWDALRTHGTFYTGSTLSQVVNDVEALEIDEPIDWDWASFLVESGRVDPAEFGLPADPLGSSDVAGAAS